MHDHLESELDNSASALVLIFDVNETLLDLESLHPIFARLFGDAKVLREWFGNLILYSMTLTLSGTYEDFWALSDGTLRMLGSIHGVDITPADVQQLQQGMKSMPAHRDCEEALSLLKAADFRMVTLTNSPPSPGASSPLQRAGLGGFFERQFNTASVRAYKPHPSVYELVSRELHVKTAACCLVACHMWDTIGAQRAGMSGALVNRVGNAALPMPGVPQPCIEGTDLLDVAKKLIAHWRR